MLSDNEKLILI